MAQPLWKLPVGAKVKFGKYQVATETPETIVWRIVAKHHTGYPENSITLNSTELLDLRCWDAPELKNPDDDSRGYGNGLYYLSNVDQWLNSDADAGKWYTAQHEYDAPPAQYVNRPGFLNAFSTKEREALEATDLIIFTNAFDVDRHPIYKTVPRKVFLPGIAEVGFGVTAEDTGWAYYITDADRQANATKQLTTQNQSIGGLHFDWWLRSHRSGLEKKYARVVTRYSSGGFDDKYVKDDETFIRPALNLSSANMVSDEVDSDGCYTFEWNVEPMPESRPAPQPKPQLGQQRLCDLPVGAAIKFGSYQINEEIPESIVWSIAVKSFPGYPGDSVTLHTPAAIDMRCLDAQEPKNPKYATTGNPTYSVSNMDQWLNSDADAGKWYTPQHDLDSPPDTSIHTGNTNTQYEERPGFLNFFSSNERNSILLTSIKTDGNYIERKVFLPSNMEISGPSVGEQGAEWHFNRGNETRYLSYQCYNNSLGKKPSSIHTAVSWWFRDGVSASTVFPGSDDADRGDVGLCPALNLPGDLRVPVEKSSDGSYYIVWDVAPTTPNSIDVPTAIYGNRKTTITWPESTDPDGDLAGYILQRSADSGDFTEIYKGADLTFTDTVTFGWKSVQYRVAAYDTVGWQSDWLTSETRTVINNSPSVISGTDENLGTKSEGFTRSYTVTDPESDRVTVEERIDDVLIRSHTPTLGETNVFSVTEDTWLRLFNGTHTMTVTAKDAIENITVRTYTFTKAVDSFTIQNIMPLTADIRPTRMRLSVTREIPAGATFTVYLCNNGFDSAPTWEDATSAVTGHLIHLFANTTKTAPAWGVGVKIEVTRGTGEGACYVSQIDGNYE